jgi:tetratricopeptide (TPR) repeat protein
MFVGRNDPCPCGSGKKFKRCCGVSGAPAMAPVGHVELVRTGMAQLQAGQLDTAEHYFQQALSLAPNDAGIYNLLGMVALFREQFAEAAKQFQKAIARNGKEPEYYNHLAHALRGQSKFEDALKALEKAIALDRGCFEAHHNLGNLLEELGRNNASLAAYQTALKLRPHDLESMQEMGELLLDMDRLQEAEANFRLLLAHYPQDAKAHCGLGDALVEQGRNSEADAVYQRVMSLPKVSDEFVSRYGLFLVRRGKLSEAEALFNKAIQEHGEQPELYFGLSACHKFTPDDRGLLDKIEQMANAQEAMSDKLASAYYAIGKANDDLKDYARAFHAYAKANNWYGSREPFDRAAYREDVDRTISFFDSTRLNVAATRNESDMPILIVGMPRSGTTLTEQIISSHPLVHGAGEMTFWTDVKKELVNEGYAAALTDACQEKIAADYLHELERFAKGARYVTDKLPGNYMNLGLIHRIFPRAKIVHCKRNPVDTCLSIYFQHFDTGHNYRYNLDNLVFVYREYLRLMQHWRMVLPPGTLIETQYEELVENQEEMSRKLIAFCGLEWDDRCLEFYKTERQVKTASKWQVRQPMYTSSKERWRNYASWIKPLMALLEEDRDS